MLGALFFLFISSNLQACVLAGGDCVNMQQAHSQPMAKMQCHEPAINSAQLEVVNVPSQHTSSGQTGDDCCQLIPVDLVDIANAQVSNPSASQLTSQWFHLHFASLSSSPCIGFAQREIIFPPPGFSSLFHSSFTSSCNVGRAPPSSMLA